MHGALIKFRVLQSVGAKCVVCGGRVTAWHEEASIASPMPYVSSIKGASLETFRGRLKFAHNGSNWSRVTWFNSIASVVVPMMNRVASHRGASTSSSRVQRFGGSLSRSAPPRWIACGSENKESSRYRLDSKQPTLEELTSFSPPLSSRRIKLNGEEIIPPISESTMWEARPGEILINTPHATRARITPVSLHLKGRPFDHDPSTADDSEYYLVDLERRYSKEWPSIEIRDGTVIFRRGFLEPLEDPQLPYRILYSGLERFTYNGSEKAMMTGITTALVAVHAAAFMALASWQVSCLTLRSCHEIPDALAP